jgi:hypothetical protein
MAGKKLQNKTSENTQVATPVVATAAAAVVAAAVVETPVVAQKGGKKGKATATVTPVVAAAPVVAAPVVAEAPVVAQKGGKKAKAVATPVAEAVTTTPVVAAVAPQKGGKKAKAAKVEAPVVTVTVTDAEAPVAELTDATERHVRSFKVKLPNKEDFEGRFTGLTPYQAANKALSKYFRETETPNAEITFSICESTRKSKKSVYTYVGRRQKLDTPVTYKIQDGREIVKNFKNSLKKVKKSDTAQTTEAVASA